MTESFNHLASTSPDIPSVNSLAQQTIDTANNLAKTIVSKAENLVDNVKESTVGKTHDESNQDMTDVNKKDDDNTTVT